MPTREEQINEIMGGRLEGSLGNLKILIRSALRQAYNRGYEAGCMKAQEQMMTDVDAGEISDGYHTFNDLYKQRMYLFAALVKVYKDKAWKSLSHEDGEPCFGGGWFIVGIDTPEGSYTYHYENTFFSLFDCEELERAKHWDGHTDADVGRLMSLTTVKAQEQMMDRQGRMNWIPISEQKPPTNDKVLLSTVVFGWHGEGYDPGPYQGGQEE